jgi:hypothetical protein
LSEEQQIAVTCVVQSGGQPYAAAACAAIRLTVRELGKCLANGVGGDGCFGDSNDLVGRDGWTARTLRNAEGDVIHGPGRSNDLVGSDGFVRKTLGNAAKDITEGAGSSNDVFGCDGWLNRNLGGGCD